MYRILHQYFIFYINNNTKYKITVEKAIFHQPNIMLMVKTLQEAIARAEWSSST